MGMYTKQIKEHFMNPRNMGEMKNPDVKAEVGNPVCIIPETPLHSNNDLKPIEGLNIGDRVLGHKGKYEKILEKTSRDYNEKILKIKNRLGTTSLTPEHLIRAIKLPEAPKYKRTKNKKKLMGNEEWLHARELGKGDLVVYPILQKEKETEFIPIDIKKKKYDFRSKDLPKKVPLNKEFLRLAGYYLSEGWARIEQCKTYLIFTFNLAEKEYGKETARIIKEIFDLDSNFKEQPDHNSFKVTVYSALLARFFRNLFGTGAENKHIPKPIMLLPPEKQKYLIKALWQGDGYIDSNTKWPRAHYTTTSKKLVNQLKCLLLRQGIIPSIYAEDAVERNGVKHKKAYKIYITGRKSLKRLSSIMDTKLSFVKNSSVNAWIENGRLYTPVTKIKEAEYHDKVQNLEVKNSHSFVSQALCLHNCGDVMEIFLKIGKKNGKEYIKDIKFQTMGCAAAIASSSMMTELVKGKTLGEAEKITKEDLDVELGGLPKNKQHCAEMAEETIKKAIKKYRGDGNEEDN